MPGGEKIPKLFDAIAQAVDSGVPIEKLSKVYGYKPDVLQKIHSVVRQVQKTGEDPEALLADSEPILQLYKKLPKPQAAPAAEEAPNPYMAGGRDKWGDAAAFPVSTDGGQPMKAIVKKVAAATGVRPEILFASAMEEGLQQVPKGGKFELPAGDFPVDGFRMLGVDDFGSLAPQLEKKYGMKLNYQPAEHTNEKGRVVKSANFRTMEDGLMAKALMYKDYQEKVLQKLRQENVSLDDDGLDFLTLQAYNAGPKVLDKYLKIYRETGTLDGSRFTQQAPEGEYKDIQSYVHSRRRFDPAKAMRQKKLFE